jgi:hypothetical protein
MGASRRPVSKALQVVMPRFGAARYFLHRRRLMCLLTVVLLAPDTFSPSAPAAVLAAPPSLSGTWVYQAPPVERAAGDRQFRPTPRPTGLCAASCTILQGAESLTIIRPAPRPETATYRFDGVERQRVHRNPISAEEVTVATRLVREGAALAFYSRAGGRRPARSRTALSLENGTLVIENWIESGGRLTARRLTYRRTAD